MGKVEDKKASCAVFVLLIFSWTFDASQMKKN